MLQSVLLALALLAFAPLASHAQYGRWDYDRAWTEQAQRQDQGDRRRSQREAGRGEDRRMSPEERRELDRDLQRADREFYRKGKDRQRRR